MSHLQSPALNTATNSGSDSRPEPEFGNDPEHQAPADQAHPGWWKSWWKKNKFWVVVSTIFLVGTALILVLGLRSGVSDQPLASDNVKPNGGKAAATILQNQGVDVVSSTKLQTTLDALKDRNANSTTVLVYDPEAYMVQSQIDAFAQAIQASGSKVVLVKPTPRFLKALNTAITTAGTTLPEPTSGKSSSGGSTEPKAKVYSAKCELPAAVAAKDIAVQGSGLSGAPIEHSISLYQGGTQCFPAGDATAGATILASDQNVTVVGTLAVFSNDTLASQGNAALSLTLLGSTERLVWYTPSISDVPSDPNAPTLSELKPPWLMPVGLWLMVVAIIGMFWRGRRNGPLVYEKLPVVVKASETITGRARLYQDARATTTAAVALQNASANRLARSLNLGTGSAKSAVVEAVSQRTGRPHNEISWLLEDPQIKNEKELINLATQLIALEEEVAQQ